MRRLALEAAEMAEVASDLNALHWALYHLAYAHIIRGEWGRTLPLRTAPLQSQSSAPTLAHSPSCLAYGALRPSNMGDWAGARREAECARAVSSNLRSYAAALALLPLARL